MTHRRKRHEKWSAREHPRKANGEFKEKRKERERA